MVYHPLCPSFHLPNSAWWKALKGKGNVLVEGHASVGSNTLLAPQHAFQYKAGLLNLRPVGQMAMPMLHLSKGGKIMIYHMMTP